MPVIFVITDLYFYYSPATAIGKQHFDVSSLDALPQVDILYSHQEQNPGFFQFSYDSGAKGIVYAGNGAGGISRDGREAAEQLHNATGISIFASRKVNAGFGTTRGFFIGSGFLNPV